MQDGKPVTVTQSQHFELERCDISQHFGNYSDLYMGTPNLNDSYCLPRDLNATVEGIDGSFYYNRKFILFINRCTNTTTYKGCKSREVIDQQLINVYLKMNFIDFNIDHDNITDPIQPFANGDRLQVSSSVYAKYLFLRKNVRYSTDFGFVFEDYDDLFLVQSDGYMLTNLDKSFGETTVSNATNIAQINIQASGTDEIYIRSYTKFQNTIANIGGTVKSLTLIAYMCSWFFTRNQFIVDIINSLPNMKFALNQKIKEEIDGNVRPSTLVINSTIIRK